VQPPDASVSEQEQIKAKGFSDFMDNPDEAEIEWIRKGKDNGCFFLDKDNRCMIYSVRPAICRLEPFTIADYDYEKDTIELELNFPAACGCVGVFEGETLPVEVIGRAAQTVVQKILALTAEDLGLPITHQKVASETRSRILRRNVEMADLFF
jgi:Fe-S-cluster containining protein